MHLSNDDLEARPLGEFPKLALWLLRDARDPALLLGSFAFWTPSMVDLGRTRSGMDRMKVLVRYMFEVIDPIYLDELRVKIATLGPRMQEVVMSIAEYFREEGVKQGRVDTLRSLLVLKFQRLGADYEERLQAATPEAIDRYLQRLLTADSLAAVFAD